MAIEDGEAEAPRVCPWELAGAAALALIELVAFRVRYGLTKVTNADGIKYLHMTTHGYRPCIAQPFCWRVAVPTLARAVPGHPHLAYTLITWFAIVATGVTAFVIARSVARLGLLPSLGATLLFVSMPGGVRDLVHDPVRIDPMAWLGVGLTILLAQRRRTIAFAIVLAVAVSVKENEIALVVLFYGLTADRVIDWRAGGRAVLAALPSLAALAVLRHEIAARGTLTLSWSIHHFGKRTLDTLLHHQVQPVANLGNRWFLTSFGITVLVLAVIGARARPNLAARLAPFVLVALIHPFLAGNIERDMILAGVPMAWLGAIGLGELQRIGRSWLAPAFLALAVAAPFVTYATGSDQQGFHEPAFEAVGLAVLGLLVLVGLGRAPRPSTPADEPAAVEPSAS